jgi:hypothetical protein
MSLSLTFLSGNPWNSDSKSIRYAIGAYSQHLVELMHSHLFGCSRKALWEARKGTSRGASAPCRSTVLANQTDVQTPTDAQGLVSRR